MNPKRTCDDNRVETAPQFPTCDEIERHLARSRHLRAEATSAMLAAAGRALALSLRAARTRLSRWHEQRRTRAALMRCSDRVLADMGIERTNIPLIARGMEPAASAGHGTASPRWWHEMHRRWNAAARARQEEHRLYRELAAYDDRELDDLGVRRADIRDIVRGREPVPAFG